MKTLKELSKALNVSESKAGRIKKKIEQDKYSGVPSHMIWGTGDRKSYNPETFREYL